MTEQAGPPPPDAQAVEAWRPQRCLLGLPASVERFIRKAADSDADAVMLDLEDSVAPNQKAEARGTVVRMLRELDWGDKWLTVRINDMDSEWAYRDLIELGEQCPRLDAFMIPKVESVKPMYAVDLLLRGVERAARRSRPFALDILIESVQGLGQIDAIAAATPRLRSISFGPGDYAASIRSRIPLVGAPDPDYVVLTNPDDEGRRATHWNDVWHYPLARIAATCHAHGLRPLDGPFPDVNDMDGYRASARRARALGFVGKWALHPSQVEHANAVFGPTETEVAQARKIVEALAQAYRNGEGEVLLEGKLINMAHRRMAVQVLQAAGEDVAALADT